MKVIIVLISLAFFLVLTGCDTNTPQNGAETAGPIVCLGDSLTEGYGAGGRDIVDKSRSYPAFLDGRVAAPVVNAGISGDTAAGALTRLERDVLSKDPQMVIILLGANDFFRLRPAAETKADLQTIINRTREVNRKIFLASFIGDASWEQAILSSMPGMILVTPLLSNYKRMFEELVLENSDIRFIPDIWTGVWEINMSDPIHPNANGYRIIAETVYNAIRLHL